MSITMERIARIFNEWAKRNSENPDEFSDALDDEGKVFTDYGEHCAAYFMELANELDKEGLLPKPFPIEPPMEHSESPLYDENDEIV